MSTWIPDTDRLVESDAGRKDAGFPKEKNDCVVRATATAFGLPYEEAHTLFKIGGRACGQGTPTHLEQTTWNDLADEQGMELIKHSFPAKKGKKRMNVREFCKTHPEGIFLTRQAGHIATVMDGKVYDTMPFAWWHWERCVYTAFELI
jgi:hypothetical protein